MKDTASQKSWGAKVVTSNCGMSWRTLPQAWRKGARSRRPAGRPLGRGWPRSGEEDQERDQQREQRDGFRQREPENADREHRVAGGRIARDRADQRAEDIADTGADTGEGENGDTGADHLGGSEIHGDFPWSEMGGTSNRRGPADLNGGGRRRAGRDR